MCSRSDLISATVRAAKRPDIYMRALCLPIVLSACVATPHPKSANTPEKKVETTESEWQAASDLAATIAKAAGGQRLASAIRVREPGPVVHRHISLAAAGCYHIGVAWVFAADMQASVELDAGTTGKAETGEHQLSAPGGALDFCTDTAGGATMTFQPVTRADSIGAPKTLELAMVYGSASEPAHAKGVKRPATRKSPEPPELGLIDP
jgi:hypothetical protein